MKKEFIDEEIFKNIEIEVKEYDIQNYTYKNKLRLLDEWKLITLQWNYNGWVSALLSALIILLLALFTSIRYIFSKNIWQTDQNHILLIFIFSLTFFFLFFNLSRLLIYRKKWRRRIKAIENFLNKIK